MKPDSPTNGLVNADDATTGNNITPTVVVNGDDDLDRDFDIMDEEVMTFMNTNVHKQLMKFTKKGAWGKKKGMMDRDTKAYFEEVIRGSALFGLMPDKDDDDDDDDFNDNENERLDNSGQGSNNPDNKSSEQTAEDTARTQLSRLLLAKKVAEAFMANKPDKRNGDEGDEDDDEEDNAIPPSDSMTSLSWDAPLMTAKENALAPDDYNEAISGRISRHSEYSIEADLQTEREDLLEEDNAAELAKRLESELAGSILSLWQQRLTQSSSFEGDIDIEYASESEVNSTGPPSPLGDDPSVIPPPAQFADNMNTRVDRNGNRSQNPTAPVRLPINMSSEANSNTALEEIRARLRKTQFDYSSDSRTRISDATPQLDYRNVLKKKGKV